MKAFAIHYTPTGRSYMCHFTVIAEGRKSCPAYTRTETEKDLPAVFGFDVDGKVTAHGARLEGAWIESQELPDWAKKEKVNA